jgi:hypothetical protein
MSALKTLVLAGLVLGSIYGVDRALTSHDEFAQQQHAQFVQDQPSPEMIANRRAAEAEHAEANQRARGEAACERAEHPNAAALAYTPDDSTKGLGSAIDNLGQSFNTAAAQIELNEAILKRDQAKIAKLRADIEAAKRQSEKDKADEARTDALVQAHADAIKDIEDCLKFRPDWTPDQPTVVQEQPAPSPQPEIKPELPADVPPVTLVPMKPKKGGRHRDNDR